MKLKSVLDRKFINTKANIHSKEEAIDLVLKQFSQDYKFKDKLEDIKQAILAREKLGGTLFDNGMAIPHARLEGFSDLLVGIVIPKTPITEKDGSVIKCLVIFLTMQAGSTLYLQTLAGFARMAQDEERYQRFLDSKSDTEVLNEIGDVVIHQNLTVKDIMSETLYSIRPESSLKELADYFYKYKISYIPVVNDDNKLVGEVNMNDLLKVGIPNYAIMIGKLDFLSHFEPFEELLKNEEKIKVEHIMRKVTLTLNQDSSLIETALEMTKHSRRHIPVTDNDRILGVVSYMDILSKVLRG